MKTRISEIIKYTGQSQTDFAAGFYWSPQYLAKLLKGVNIGLKPIAAILEKYPEINARWLLFGNGEMIEKNWVDVLKGSFCSYKIVLELEKFICVMNKKEIADFELLARGNTNVIFSNDQINRWREKLDQKTNLFSEKYNRLANQKTNENAKPRKSANN